MELELNDCFRVPIYLVNCYGLTVDQIVLDGGLQEWIMEWRPVWLMLIACTLPVYSVGEGAICISGDLNIMEEYGIVLL